MSKEHNGDTDGHTLPEKVRGIITRKLDYQKVEQEQRWTNATRAAGSKLNKELLTNISAHGLVLASPLVPMAVYGEIVTAATKATREWPHIVWKTVASILDEAHVELRDGTQLNALVDEYAWAIKQEPFTLGHIDPDRFKDFVRRSTSRYGGIHQYVWDDFERSMQSRAGLAQLGIINTAALERGAIGNEIDKYVIAHRVPKVKPTLAQQVALTMKHLFAQYRRLGLMKKITLWDSLGGALATVIGLFVSIFSPQATSENQTTYGNQSPNISNVQGNVNVTISGQSGLPSTGKQYVLRNPRGGVVAILNAPRSGAVMDVKQHACESIISGTAIELLNDKSSEAGIDIWRKVKVIDGVCSGKIGWVMVSDISFE